MAFKKIIVDYLGKLSELLGGDTINPIQLGSGTPTSSNYLRGDGTWSTVSGGSLPVLTEIEIDFGTKPINNKTFTIIDPTVIVTDKISILPSTNSATGQLGNDWEVDNAFFSTKANTGSFTLYVNAQFSISGKRKTYYQILN